MHTPSNRDVAFERALRSAVRRNDGDSSDPCPDANTLAAWADRALTREVTALVESHMSVCPRCQSILAALSRMDGSDATPTPSLWRQWRLQWLVPFAAAATAVALWVGRPDPSSVQQTAVVTDVGAQPGETALSSTPANSTAPTSPVEERRVAAGEVVAAPVEPTRSAALNAVPGEADSPSAGAGLEQAPSTDTTREAAGFGATRVPGAAPALPAAAAQASPPSAPGNARTRAADGSATDPVLVESPVVAVRWRIVDGQRIERSTSAGATWEAATVAPPARLIAGSAPSDRVCWVVGPAGAIRRTTDGLVFTPLPFPEVVDLVAVRATSDSVADVTTSDGRTYRTVDGGGSWNRVAP